MHISTGSWQEEPRNLHFQKAWVILENQSFMKGVSLEGGWRCTRVAQRVVSKTTIPVMVSITPCPPVNPLSHPFLSHGTLTSKHTPERLSR